MSLDLDAIADDKFADRIRHFLASYERVSGLDPEMIHSVHSIPGDEPGMLLVSDLRRLLAALAAVEQDRDRLRPVVEAAQALGAWWSSMGAPVTAQAQALAAELKRFNSDAAEPSVTEGADLIGTLTVLQDAVAAGELRFADPGEPSGTEAGQCGCSFERWGRESFKITVCDEHTSGKEAGRG